MKKNHAPMKECLKSNEQQHQMICLQICCILLLFEYFHHENKAMMQLKNICLEQKSLEILHPWKLCLPVIDYFIWIRIKTI